MLQALPDIRKEHGIEWASDPLLAQLSQIPSLTLTIWDDKEQSIPVKELGSMSLPEFAKLYSVSLLALLITSASELVICPCTLSETSPRRTETFLHPQAF